MGKDPAFLFYPGDYLRDTQNLSEKSQVAYDRIMCEHMRNICEDMNNIAVSKRQVDFFTKRLNNDEKEELLFVLIKNGVHYQIEWVALSIAKRKAYSNSRSQNRLSKSKKDMKNISKHMVNEDEIVNENKNINIEFEKFWNLYDYKKNKIECEKLWNGIKKTKYGHIINNETRSLIIKRLPIYIKNSYKDDTYPGRMHPHTYLNQECWNDEVVENNKKRKLIGYIYECPECKEYFVHDEDVGNHTLNCPECPKTERMNGLMLSDSLEYIQTIYEE